MPLGTSILLLPISLWAISRFPLSDLCEDESVRAVIMSLQVEAQRRRLLSFARDSRRMSKR